MSRNDRIDRSFPEGGPSPPAPDSSLILANLPSAVLAINRAGEITYCNSRVENLLETDRRNLLRRPFADALKPLGSAVDLDRALRHGLPLEATTVAWETSGGARKFLSLGISPLVGSDKDIAGAIIEIRDEDLGKEIRADRENLLSELHTTIRAIADAVIIYRPNGDIVHMNPAARRLLGYQETDLSKPIGERLAKFRVETPDGDPFPVEQTLRRMLAGQSFTGLIAVVRRDRNNPIWLSLSGAPIFSSRGEVIAAVGTGTDITALHCADEERSHCMQMLTHDLRSPLTVIHGHAQLLETRLKKAPEDELLLHIKAIRDASQHMSVMLSDLVDMASIEGGKYSRHREAVPLGPFMENFFNLHCMALDCDRIIADLPEPPPTLLANPNALERILLNLLSNALKYSPPEHEVRIAVNANGTMATFAVEDRGCGIEAEHIPFLFRRFARLPGKSRADSLGLGLYIARLLVESQKGEISVTSTPGQGSTFTFTLPLLSD